MNALLAMLLWTLPLLGTEDWSARAIEIGWEDRFASIDAWTPEPWLVSQPEANAPGRIEQSDGLFEVGAGREMAWTRTTNPVCMESFPTLEVEYTLDSGEATLALSDDSTGPITPGALNAENPLASGARTQITLPSGQSRLTVDLRPRFKSDRIARITLVVRGLDQPGRVRLHRVAFRAADREPTATQAAPLIAHGNAAPLGNDWQAIPIGDPNSISAERLAQAFGASTQWQAGRAVVTGIPFALGAPEAAARATGVMETGTIELRGRWRGSELGLLLAMRAFGSDKAAFGQGPVRHRPAIVSPHELAVHLEYADGTRTSHFPWSVRRKAYAVERAPDAYVVPLRPDRHLVGVTIEDRMSFGQVFLLGASVNAASPAALPSALALPTQHAARTRPAAAPVVAQCDADTLHVTSAWWRLRADTSSGLMLSELALLPLDARTICAPEGGAPLIELLDEGGKALPLVRTGAGVANEVGAAVVQLTWSVPERQLELRLAVEGTEAGELVFTPSLRNLAGKAWEGSLVCPRLEGLRIAPDERDRWYLLGTRSTTLSNAPIRTEHLYGGAFPLQLIDVFASEAGGGVGLLVRDTQLVSKTFSFQQDAGGSRAKVTYPHLRVPAKGETALPATVLFAHPGDWHEAFDRCRAELRALPEPERSGHMDDLFYCRRDYPLGGTDYLFDPPSRRYTPKRLIAESQRGFGGIDMIDISGGAYNEATGRVGDYRTNDIGGLEELRRAVQAAHAGGVKVGLYFEGYLLDRRCKLAVVEGLPAWQIIGKDGKPKWWPGEMEFFACPGVAKWREELASAMADVASATGADAVYVDEFGFCDAAKACWSPGHEHPVPSNPLVEEQRMLSAIRAALDRKCPQVAIYLEQIPCDTMLRMIDGAFNYGMAGATLHETGLALHRFAFPEVASIEMVGYGIRPVPVNEDDLHRCVFQGMAIWLKGRADSWYSEGFRETARRAHGILRRYAGVFRSPECRPLVPTLVPQLYANTFATRDQSIVTLYNGQYSSIEGDLLSVPIPEGRQVRDLWNDRPAAVRVEDGRAVLTGRVAPRSVGIFLIERPTTAR